MADDEPTPQLLQLDGEDTEVFGLATHPSRDLLALGLVDGRALLYGFEGMGERCALRAALSPHEEACRVVAFHPEGGAVYTGASDKSLRAHNVETGQEAWAVKPAHDEAINAMHFCAEEGLLATGDDAGVVKLWDCRAPPTRAASTIKKNEDFISDLLSYEGLLFAASGDNTLTTYDLKARKTLERSMDQEDELLSLCVMKHGRKLVAGTQSGVLLVYSWGQWANCSDRFVGHPETVEALVKVDEETILTGSSDGLIRLCTVQPNKLLGVLGSHDDFPVERMAFTHDRRLLASIAHDSAVRLWDMTILEDDGEEDEDEEASGSEAEAAGAEVEAGGSSDADSFSSEEEGSMDEEEDEEDSGSASSSASSGSESSDSEGEEEDEEGGGGKQKKESIAEIRARAAAAATRAAAAQRKKGQAAGGAKVEKGEGKTAKAKRGGGGSDSDSDSDSGGSGGGGGGGKKQGEEEKGKGAKGKKKLRMTEAEAFFQDL